MNNRIIWEPLVSAAAIIFTILGVVVPIFSHLEHATEARMSRFHEENVRLDNKMELRFSQFHEENMKSRAEMLSDLRDFHSHLERTDSDFKNELKNIERDRFDKKIFDIAKGEPKK